MENVSKEEIIKHFNYTKERILKSNILLTPKWSSLDEDALDYIGAKVIELTLRDINNPPENNSVYTEEERKCLTIFASLTVASMELDMVNNEEFTNKVYDSFVKGEFDNASDNSKEVLRKKIKKGLISHEQYEKIKDIDKPNDNI